ncbi:Protein kinase-like domain protein [Niveomyces insectorum RCEF 264]|uniref:Protein kinase-like domain protein n=1 Tax=Niveomyces insectorum RCEF 264 TaxID=1081102 RepID=A0A168A427_9HYPO|nr:Protein kinase-like domain protein [Niveomyces insectorum RCEF 264]
MAEEKTIFIVEGAAELLKTEPNEAFLCDEEQTWEEDEAPSLCSESFYERHDTPTSFTLANVLLRITTDHKPKNPHRGFVIGRGEECDIVLNDARISTKHLTLQLDYVDVQRSILLKNHFWGGTPVQLHKSEEKLCQLRSTRSIMEHETVDIWFAGKLHIQIRRLGIPVNWAQYCAEQQERIKKSMPAFDDLQVASTIQTTHKSTRPPVYNIVIRLGKGGQGEVFKVYERYTGRAYAMKLYKSEKGRPQEAELLKRVNHEHIVKYVAYNCPEGKPVELIMEYVEGPNLAHVLDPFYKHPPLANSEVRDLLRQLVLAIAHLHAEGITHRDIKPANILVAQRCPIRIKLTDFGLATSKPDFQTYCGTPLYYAPELFTRHARNTNQADMFSVGVVALELLCGFRFQGDVRSAKACVEAVLRERAALATRYPRPFPVHVDLVYRLLSENRGNRLSAKQCVGHAFFHTEAPFVHSLDPPGAVAAPEVSTEAAPTREVVRTRPVQHVVDGGRRRIQHQHGVTSEGVGEEARVEASDTSAASPSTSKSTSTLSPRNSNARSKRRPSKRFGLTVPPRYKRQKHRHNRASASRGSFQSKAPSPSEPYGEDDGEFVDFGPGKANHSTGSSCVTAASDVTRMPDTEVYGDVPGSPILGCQQPNRLPSPSTSSDVSDNERPYDGCWHNPLHQFGGGSFRPEEAEEIQESEEIEKGRKSKEDEAGHPFPRANQNPPSNEQEAASTLPHKGSLHEDNVPDTGGNTTHDCVVIQGHRVRVDAANGLLDFLEICAAAKTDFYTRRTCLHMAETRGVLVSKQSGQPWIRFKDAFFLCERLGLSTESLLSLPGAQAEVPNRRKNYFLLPGSLPPDYDVLWWNKEPIFYRPADRQVNATRLVQSLGQKRNYAAHMLARHPELEKTRTRRERAFLQGFYVAMEDALRLCISNDLHVGPIRHILADCGIGVADLPAEEEEDSGCVARKLKLPRGYRQLTWDGRPIVYVPQQQTVNATHLLASLGLARHKLPAYFNKWPDVPKTVRKGKTLHGTYMSVDNATHLCRHFDLDMDCIKELRRLISLHADEEKE